MIPDSTHKESQLDVPYVHQTALPVSERQSRAPSGLRNSTYKGSTVGSPAGRASMRISIAPSQRNGPYHWRPTTASHRRNPGNRSLQSRRTAPFASRHQGLHANKSVGCARAVLPSPSATTTVTPQMSFTDKDSLSSSMALARLLAWSSGTHRDSLSLVVTAPNQGYHTPQSRYRSP